MQVVRWPSEAGNELLFSRSEGQSLGLKEQAGMGPVGRERHSWAGQMQELGWIVDCFPL